MMKHPRFLLPLAVMTPFLLANEGRVDTPAYGPESGATLTKSWTVESELELEDMSLELNGADVSEMAGEVEMAMRTTMTLTVTDTYAKMGDGRPARLERSFDEITSSTHVSQSNPMAGEDERDLPLASELEGETVVFTWDEDDASYQVAFDDGGDEDLLHGLEEDMDMRGFLPAGEVSEGDSWEIPAAAVKAALTPGGNLKLMPEGQTNPMGGAEQFSPSEMIGELDGDFKATYRGTRDDDGVTVAVIEIEIDANSASDMTEKVNSMQDAMKENMPEGMDVEIASLDAEFEIVAEGELLWNMETGLVYALHLSGQVGTIVDISMTMHVGDDERAMDLSQTFSGEQSFTLTTGD